MTITVGVLQFARDGGFNACVEKARRLLEGAPALDFLLLGGEYALHESADIDPYPALQVLAKDMGCTVVVPVHANRQRFPELSRGSRQKGFAATHVFGRDGRIVGVQEKQHFYWRERPWFQAGRSISVFEVDGARIGLVRGLDMLYPAYTFAVREAEVIFFPTMAEDDLMLQLALTRAVENQCYVVMSSFIGRYIGRGFVGNAAIVEPVFEVSRGIRAPRAARLLSHLTAEGLAVATCDLDYVRRVKREYPMADL